MNAVDSAKRTRLSQRYWGSHVKSVKLADSLSQVQGALSSFRDGV